MSEESATNSDLISFLFSVLLFPSSSSSVAVCQSQQSRYLVYTVLYNLCENNIKNFGKLVAAVVGNSSLRKNPSINDDESEVSFRKKNTTNSRGVWDYNPNALLKASDEFVGLSNQGGTCYMNSFIQQLYHIRPFTNGLLRISEYLDHEEYDTVLFQLQVMFGHLRLSQKKFYDTLPFCQSLVEYDGQPISLSEQKDINEFAGMLFDKLEKNRACSQLLDRTIRGKLVWKTRSLETPYRSEKEEPFDMITVEVKEKKNIEESLELSVAEELFSGENKIEDSVAGRKVDAVRSCAIRTLPPTLIIQLKRFEFDLETLNRKKINDYFSFPMELNMFPYTEEGIFQASNDTADADLGSDDVGGETGDDGMEESDRFTWQYQKFSTPTRKADNHYRYVLTGIVAHVGAIDRGHYYSFIKDRETGQWREFNDRTVLPFSPEQIPRECFGGYEEIVNPNNSTTTIKYRENNAYLLVYERYDPRTETKLLLSPSVSNVRLNEIRQSAFRDNQRRNESSSAKLELQRDQFATDNEGEDVAIAEKVLSTIWTENTSFQIDRFLFDRAYFQLFWQLSSCSSLNDVNEGALDGSKVAILEDWSIGLLKFIVEVAVHARAKYCVGQFLERLEDSVLRDKNLIVAGALLRWLNNFDSSLKEIRPEVEADVRPTTTSISHPWLVTIFVDCPHGSTVKSFARMIVTIFNAIQPQLSSDISAFNIFSQETVIERDKQGNSIAEDWLALLPSISLFYVFAKTCNQVLSIIESLQPEDIVRKDGYRYACWILHQVAVNGVGGCLLLIRLNTIERLVCTILSLNPVSSQVPAEQLSSCIDVVTHLIQTAKFVDADTASHDVLAQCKLRLNPNDIFAFLNKVFLEEAISINPHESSIALQHVASTLLFKDSVKLVEYLLEKVLECTTSNAGTALAYRPYFKVLSDLMLVTWIDDIGSYSPSLRKLAAKAYALSTRQLSNDAEFVYAVCKFLHRIGTSGTSGYATVMNVNDYWREIAVRYAHASTKKQSISVFSMNVNNAGKT